MSENRPTFGEHEFRKASMSEGPKTDCVRVARRDGWVEIRDDKIAFGAPDDRRLVFTDTEFDAVLAALRAGTPTTDLPLHITRHADGTHTFRRATSPGTPHLIFTATEVTAFLAGVHAHEFDLPAYAA